MAFQAKSGQKTDKEREPTGLDLMVLGAAIRFWGARGKKFTQNRKFWSKFSTPKAAWLHPEPLKSSSMGTPDPPWVP